MTEKEKEEKKDKKEVWNTLNGLLTVSALHSIVNYSSSFHFYSEKKEGEEEVQQGEKRPPF